MKAQARNEGVVGSWNWLFPTSYLIHITEEYLGGFQQWISRIWGVDSSSANSLIWNGGALALMIVGILVMLRTRSYRWLLVGFGTVLLINALAHAISSIVTRSYSPGLISGAVLFAPLGVYTLARCRSEVNARTFRAGVVIGVAMHLAVVLLAFGFAKLSD